MSAPASEVMRRGERLDRARRLGITEPLEFARSRQPFPIRQNGRRRFPVSPGAASDLEVDIEETREPLFAGRCALCGARTKHRYCHAHRWAEEE